MNDYSVTGLLQTIIDDMCENYCRYTEEAKQAMEEDRDCEKCENCPLLNI